jgi:hypothetical protein
LFADGSPVPISRNCRIPASATKNRTARPKNARFSRAAARMVGTTRMSAWPVSLSAAKWSLPPR